MAPAIGPNGAVDEKRLERGAAATFGWQGVVWTPFLEFRVHADQTAPLGDRTVAFRVIGFHLDRNGHDASTDP